MRISFIESNGYIPLYSRRCLFCNTVSSAQTRILWKHCRSLWRQFENRATLQLYLGKHSARGGCKCNCLLLCKTAQKSLAINLDLSPISSAPYRPKLSGSKINLRMSFDLRYHYSVSERPMSTVTFMDKKSKSVLCDTGGIIVAEMVYRCLVCKSVFETPLDVQIHHHCFHEEVTNANRRWPRAPHINMLVSE